MLANSNKSSSIYHAFFVPAVINGLFLAIITKTGINISPAGIGLRVFDALQPFVTEQNVVIFRFMEIFLLILPWISYIVIVVKFGIKGLIAYGAIIVISYGIILSLWK